MVKRSDGRDASSLETATLRVSLVSRSRLEALQSCRLVVDGRVVGSVRDGRPLTMPLSRGEHEIAVKRWLCAPKPMRIKVTDASRIDLYTGQRGSAPRPISYPALIRWTRECALWLSDEAAAPQCDFAYPKASYGWLLRVALSVLVFAGLTGIAVGQGRSLTSAPGLVWIALGVLGTVGMVVVRMRTRH